MRFRRSTNLLWVIILLGATVFINGQVEAAGSTLPEAADKVLQFTSGGHVLGFGSDGVTVAGGSHALRVQFVNAHNSIPVSDGPSGKGLPGNTQQAAPLSRVTYPNLWDGVTLTYDAPGGAVARSTYRIDAYARSENIRLRYNAPVSVESDGSLRISFQTGAMNESAPRAWQQRDGQRVPVRIAFTQRGKTEIGFAVGKYDRSELLFIDPTLTWNTFLGGGGEDSSNALAVDGSGNIYVAGASDATWGSPLRAYSLNSDAFVAKLDSSGNLIWNTFLGGRMMDSGDGVAVDGSGNVYVTGVSSASWGSPVRAFSGGVDAFAAKLNSSGNLIWNTFLGGSVNGAGSGVAVDGSGNVYVAGSSGGTWGSPVRAFGGSGDAFAAKLNSSGNLVWNTFLGGSGDVWGDALALDGSGNVYVAGSGTASWGSPVRPYSGGTADAFAARLDSSGNLIWNTFLGGGEADYSTGLAVDGSGNVYVVGYSYNMSWGSPVRAFGGYIDVFAAKLDSSGNLTWNTFLGGSGADYGSLVAVDESGNVYVAGSSSGTWGSPVSGYSGDFDAFAAKLNSSGNLIWNKFLGGSGTDWGMALALDGSGNAYVAGSSSAAWGSPVRAFNVGDDAFVAKISDISVGPPLLNVPGAGAGEFSTAGSAGTVRAGYASVGPYNGNAPYGTAVFSYTQSGVVVTEAGVPASPPTTDALIFIDFRSAVPSKSGREDAGTININTGFAIVNPGSLPANLTFRLKGSAGVPLTPYGHAQLAAFAHKAMFIDQLNSWATDFVLPAGFSTSTQFATLEIVSDDQPVSVVGLRLTVNQRGETLLTSTPVADLTKPGSPAPAYFPQMVDGGGYHTTIILMNTMHSPETGNVSFIRDDGTALPLRMTDGQTGSTLPYNIPAGGFVVFQTDGTSAGLSVGSVQVGSNGFATPAGAGILSYVQGGILVTETGIPSTVPTNHALIYVDTSGGHNTGVAIAAPTANAVDVTVKAFQNDGTTAVGTQGNIHLAGNGHTASFAGQMITGLPPGFTGVLDISSTNPFVALTLRSLNNSRGDFLITTFPIADFNLLAPAPIVFPQIADGGGYKTQIILLNTEAGQKSATIVFAGDNGQALDVSK
jgi:hypothetical protein